MPSVLALVQQTGPNIEPVTLAELKSHTRIDGTDDDTYLTNLILAARRRVELKAWRSLIDQTWDWFFEDFPTDEMDVPRPPLKSVTHIKHYDKDDIATTVATTVYRVDSNRDPGQILLKESQSWPSTTLRTANGVEIRFVAGYGAATTDVPEELRQAILITAAELYERREELGENLSPVALTVDRLIADYRSWSF